MRRVLVILLEPRQMDCEFAYTHALNSPPRSHAALLLFVGYLALNENRCGSLMDHRDSRANCCDLAGARVSHYVYGANMLSNLLFISRILNSKYFVKPLEV
jgi:hypothetical protein